MTSASESGLEMRRALSKLCALPAVGWAVVVLAAVSAGFQGVKAPALNLLVALTPGLVLIPGVLYVIRVHRAADLDEASGALRNAFVLGAAGLILLIGGAYLLYGTEKS
jgi:hypothetical protein